MANLKAAAFMRSEPLPLLAASSLSPLVPWNTGFQEKERSTCSFPSGNGVIYMPWAFFRGSSMVPSGQNDGKAQVRCFMVKIRNATLLGFGSL